MALSVSRALYDEVGRVAEDIGCAPPFCGEPSPLPDGGSANARRVPLDALLQRLAVLERGGDDDIGLRLGRRLGPSALGVPGYIAMAGPTLLEALPRIMNCQKLVADGVAVRVTVDGELARFRLEYRGFDPPPVFADLLVAGLRFFGAWLIGSEPALADVWFRRSRPASTGFREQIFGVAPRFGCDDDGFALARSWFDAPLRTAEASLVPVLEAQASRLLAGIREDDFLASVGGLIVERIGAGAGVEIGEIAARLHASPRTLQRRLRAHGTTFARLLQEVRMDMATRLLDDQRLSVAQIAQMLGYQEQSSFCHAYRQWTGRSPSDARRVRL